MKKKNILSSSLSLIFFIIFLFVTACSQDEDQITNVTETDCIDVDTVKDLDERGDCNEVLTFTNEVSITKSATTRIISSNSIPDHKVGLFGEVSGSLNPNAIEPVYDTYTIALHPELSGSTTYLLSSSGPQYELGVLLNGVLLDPEAAEPWPHDGIFSPSVKNWEWNLDAMSINLGMDCNNAHVQPSGKYHHHGSPDLYLESIDASTDEMTMVGFASDGFPIYYRYGFKDGDISTTVELESSYQLKTGERPGDGESAPCGEYSGIYTNDYEYISGLGDLDECNGKSGVTPEYPGGTYYYVITETYPFLPRCVKGTPSNDFKLR